MDEDDEYQPALRPRPVTYVRKSLGKRNKKILKWLGISLIILALLSVIFVFVGFPLIFMHSIQLQRLLMFTNLGLASDKDYFRKYEIQLGLRNLYITVQDTNKDPISLGVWHMLPHAIKNQSWIHDNFSYEYSLKHSNFSVLLYFHGTGEDRSNSLLKYEVLRLLFHVITFDYRSYADSSKADLSEDAVVNDCIQLYQWLDKSTNAPIFIWGHSLGSALATRTAAMLKTLNVTQPVGLIIESAFTKMSEELYVHPYGRIFSWLPWFEATVLKPLEKNGFIFNTRKNIENVDYPLMILTAEDDSIVPYRFGHELYQIARNRTLDNTTFYYQFPSNYRYDHIFIYEDAFLPYIFNYFVFICNERRHVDVILGTSEV